MLFPIQYSQSLSNKATPTISVYVCMYIFKHVCIVIFMWQVAIETMVDRARNLDSYLKPLLAPLGIFFPFPYECRLLDSYMRKDSDISSAKAQYNLTGKDRWASLCILISFPLFLYMYICDSLFLIFSVPVPIPGSPLCQCPSCSPTSGSGRSGGC